MLFDKIQDNTVLQIRSDKIHGSCLEAFDVEEDRKSPYAHTVDRMKKYVNEDFGPSPDSMQGNIRKVFETVLKTKYYPWLGQEIKEKRGLATILNKLDSLGMLDDALKLSLFNLCNVANYPHHGGIMDAPRRDLTRDEVIPLIEETCRLLPEL